MRVLHLDLFGGDQARREFTTDLEGTEKVDLVSEAETDVRAEDEQKTPVGSGCPTYFQIRPRQIKFLAVVIVLVFSTTVFIALDWLYSTKILRSAGQPTSCIVADPVRHHAFRPNCESTERWGGHSYEVFTNNLGLRDEKITRVPLTDPRPRVLFLGDSYTEALGVDWRNSYVGRIASRFPQYDFLNGGVESYSPSNYLNVTRQLLAAGVEFDEVIVFVDISDTQDEAAYYRDLDASGAVTGPARKQMLDTWESSLRMRMRKHLLLTNYVLEIAERSLVKHGYYHLATELNGNVFDMERSAWTYRTVSDTLPMVAGYAPLGVEGGIAREKAKMSILWGELEKRDIPISVVVYPWPAQVVHDTADSRQVRVWRDWCEGKCKRFISLFPSFLAVKDQCPRNEPGCWYLSQFIFGDTHYSVAGNTLVAAAVIPSLETIPPTKASGPSTQ